MPRSAYIMIIAIAFLALILCLCTNKPSGTLAETLPQTSKRILLLPLDSRPPCTQLVADNARTASIDIISPPSELMDFYSLPGNTKQEKEWLSQQLPSCQGAIVSIDQLLYGGLLASREHELPQEKIEELTVFLRQLHDKNPNVPLYAFAILPRMNPPDKIDGYHDRKNIMKWSKLMGQLADNAFEDNSSKSDCQAEINRLEATIPAEALTTYKERYIRNLMLCQALVDLTNEGVLAQLVFAQDDGERHSYPNQKVNELKEYIDHTSAVKHENNHDKNKKTAPVSIIHGADEVALSILVNIAKEASPQIHKAYIDYNAPDANEVIPLYMAITMEETIRERLSFHGTHLTANPDEADYILLASYGNSDNTGYRLDTVKKLQSYYAQGKPVALVDLSHHFSAKETLFPIMIKENYPLHTLLSYAGWNTASNSIGTAIGQAEICLSALERAQACQHSTTPIVYSNILCLNNRYMEDYYYLKDVIDVVNSNLRQQGYRNVNDLDLEHNFRTTTRMLQQAMVKRGNYLKHTPSFTKKFTLPYLPISPEFQADSLSVDAGFPWPRTFEVRLVTSIGLYQQNQ